MGKGKRDMKYIGRLEIVLIIKVTLPPLKKYIFFQLANQWSIFSTTPFQIYLALLIKKKYTWPYRRLPTEDQDTSKAKGRSQNS
jgi:hypothetical protein